LVIAPQNGPVVSRLTYNPTEKDVDTPSAQIVDKARKAFEPLTSFGFSLINNTKATSYHDGIQKMGKFMPSSYYQKAANLSAIPPTKLAQLIKDLCEMSTICPISNMGTGIIIMPLSGVLSQMALDQFPTAAVFGSMKWCFVVIVEFPKGQKDPKLREKCIEWVRETHALVEPYGSKDQG
jgi:hypothetical protein